MKFQDAVRGRRSIRAFLDKPVSKETLTELLETSRWAPSGANCQPWRVTVAVGEKRDELVGRIAERSEPNGKPPKVQPAQNLPPEFAERLNELLAEFAKLAEESGTNVQELLAGGLRFYGAPAVVVVSYESWFGENAPPGVWTFVTTMLLVAHDMGLGTCWIGVALAHRDVLRETLGIPEPQRIAAAVALGYPDLDSAVNRFKPPRDDVDSFVRWVGS